jgi:hydrocephalus-inducing protein
VIEPGCDEPITVKFSPTECENNERLLVVSIDHLSPEMEKLIIELDAETERPICHFELPPVVTKKRELDSSRYKFLDFESIGTKVLNTKRFYVANPTA